MMKDPVCGMQVDEKKSPTSVSEGKKFAVASPVRTNSTPIPNSTFPLRKLIHQNNLIRKRLKQGEGVENAKHS
jgi:hypothetical protein